MERVEREGELTMFEYSETLYRDKKGVFHLAFFPSGNEKRLTDDEVITWVRTHCRNPKAMLKECFPKGLPTVNGLRTERR
ncbi:MAG TPA: hypothetical protein VEF33_09705 [Syntrophales bacterium]|nr:hypothetical protein [Syntrophales bacterium]